ncbi:MAG: chemotaxis protein CheW [Desulfuromonadaceae bacterium]|nr:chemotaxis protein CheW [Desulfuromonadaceae bacterium]
MAFPTSSGRRFLIFALQGSLFALDLAQVAEVRDPAQTWPIPLAPAYYTGALSFHGDIIAVMDLALFLCLPGNIAPGKLIVLNKDVSSLAFLVDRIVTIVSAEEAPFASAEGSRYIAATLSPPDGDALLLDLEVLVHEAEHGMRAIFTNKMP